MEESQRQRSITDTDYHALVSAYLVGVGGTRLLHRHTTSAAALRERRWSTCAISTSTFASTIVLRTDALLVSSGCLAACVGPTDLGPAPYSPMPWLISLPAAATSHHRRLLF